MQYVHRIATPGTLRTRRARAGPDAASRNSRQRRRDIGRQLPASRDAQILEKPWDRCCSQKPLRLGGARPAARNVTELRDVFYGEMNSQGRMDLFVFEKNAKLLVTDFCAFLECDAVRAGKHQR